MRGAPLPSSSGAVGRISYSLYLVHGPVMHGVGYRVFPLIWAAVGRDGWRDPVGLALGWLVVFSVVFYIADRVMVAVDELRSVGGATDACSCTLIGSLQRE
ncbi:hypothetical protein N7491_004785 [Penicillium cf. griseofulvum]|uniref:Acyltransferase 3 domain-containing protein n=1 Tax=Penicillium cf. griseofulvum TaxID=2972120 RepID=A0A9W9J527_9EURO|nr:hypothetical protein N7472_007474 [Penicillium cf. griseofulvum]KAJ5434190.1 hypothetical protein N7491_004785 [Penicillium cf. griseofulvum]KAJ5452015.1 hypothetical protein N7445_000198 [Penicillium cf. griseofulvum]